MRKLANFHQIKNCQLDNFLRQIIFFTNAQNSIQKAIHSMETESLLFYIYLTDEFCTVYF